MQILMLEHNGCIPNNPNLPVLVFLVVSACPAAQHADICRAAPSKSQLVKIDELPFPDLDPVQGAHGPLCKYWKCLPCRGTR